MGFKSGRHFLQILRPTNVPERVLRAIGQATIDHRGPEFAQLAMEVFQGLQQVFKTSRHGRHLSFLRDRGLGSVAGQHPVSRRHGAHVRDRPFCRAVARRGPETRPRGRFRSRRLAPRRRPGGRRGEAGRGPGPEDQGGGGRPQRDLDRSDQPAARRPQGDRPRRPSGAFAWWIRSRRWPRSTTGTTSGAST
ncbi:MAG: hypothetical protein MZV70_51775 [Desulfobacterales bacterium]|nr:hypothetical protein [Desulfobacterales bacterium]